jgi:hypothetical protein
MLIYSPVSGISADAFSRKVQFLSYRLSNLSLYELSVQTNTASCRVAVISFPVPAGSCL